MQSAAWYQIGEWQYLPHTGELQRGTIRHRLEPRVADVLTFLVCRAGTVVSRTELLEQGWHRKSVVDASITLCISQIRKALGDTRPHRYIETLPNRGYRFVAAVGFAQPTQLRLAAPANSVIMPSKGLTIACAS